jgi:hypothetical protein
MFTAIKMVTWVLLPCSQPLLRCTYGRPFCRLILPDFVSKRVSALLDYATSGINSGRRQLTPKERVDHLLCNSDDGFNENIGKFFGAGGFVLPLSVVGWLHNSADTWGPMLWCLRVVSPGIILLCCIGTLRTLMREVRRTRIRTILNAERDRMDPDSKNPRIFVSRRDSEELARILFDQITTACYVRAMTVLQYSDFDWPSYNRRWPAGGQGYSDAMPEPYWQAIPNPGAVRAASILVWLDIGKTSKPMQLELETARQAHIPLVRLHPVGAGAESIEVSQGSHIYGTATLETIPALTVSVLEEILSAQINRAL